MQSEKINATDNSGASLICGGKIEESANATGVYTVTCVDADGQVKWSDTFDNTVVTVGKALLLNAMFAGTSPSTTWYLGLVNGATTPAYSTGDTMASHAGWSETVPYSNATRPAATFTATATNSIAAAAATFNINGTATVAGAFLVNNNTKSGTTGTLYSAGDFSSGNRSILNGDTLNVTYTASC
jgi:hypothetical protein